MPKATLMVRFKRPSDPNWIRRPAVYGSTGRVRSGFAEFKDRDTRRTWVEEVPDNYTFEIVTAILDEFYGATRPGSGRG